MNMLLRTSVQKNAKGVIIRLWFADVPGYSTLKLSDLGDGRWWIDLVRVGSPSHRGQGLGNRVLETGVRYAFDAGATNIGLHPHALGKPRFDLADWYRRRGFIYEDGTALWLRPLE